MTIIIHTLLSTQKIHNLTMYKLYSKQFFTNYPKFNKILTISHYSWIMTFSYPHHWWTSLVYGQKVVYYLKFQRTHNMTVSVHQQVLRKRISWDYGISLAVNSLQLKHWCIQCLTCVKKKSRYFELSPIHKWQSNVMLKYLK